MPRQARLMSYTIGPYHSTKMIELEDGEVARMVRAEYVADRNEASDIKEWQVLVLVGPPETVDEMAAAMRRTLENAP